MRVIGRNIKRKNLLFYGLCLLVFLLLIIFLILPKEVDVVSANLIVSPIQFREFLLSEDYFNLTPEQYFSRDRKVSWSVEEVERFWVPVKDLIGEYLSKENERRATNIFSDIP